MPTFEEITGDASPKCQRDFRARKSVLFQLGYPNFQR